jgi:hypothetical protein
MLLKVIAALAVGAVLGGIGIHLARERLRTAVDEALDPSLLSAVEAHPWDPLHAGHARRAERVSFGAGAVTTARCNTTLGTYAVSITHRFTFSPTTEPVPAHCPGRPVRRALGRASRVEHTTTTHRDTLTFTDPKGRTVLVLVARGDQPSPTR